MRSFKRTVFGASLIVLLMVMSAARVNAQDGDRQYKAAVTRIFLWKYAALATFKENPIFPGSVLELRNDHVLFEPDRCYARPQGGHYVGTDEFHEGMTVATSAVVKVAGDVLSKRLAEVQAETGLTFNATVSIQVAPLSLDRFRPDAAAMRDIKPIPQCQLILDLLDRRTGRYLVVEEVLHGTILYEFKLDVGSALDASARSALLAKVAKLLSLKQAAIHVSNNIAFITVAASPAPKTQAVDPENLSHEELARVTYFLQGKKGADLEIAVNEALTAGDVGMWKKALTQIHSVLGSPEIVKHKEWVEDFVNGKEPRPTALLRKGEFSDVDWRSVANYAAAIELIK
jgi:hypothetical protein